MINITGLLLPIMLPVFKIIRSTSNMLNATPSTCLVLLTLTDQLKIMLDKNIDQILSSLSQDFVVQDPCFKPRDVGAVSVLVSTYVPPRQEEPSAPNRQQRISDCPDDTNFIALRSLTGCRL